MRSAVIFCTLVLTLNLLLLEKGKEMVVEYQNSNKRKFLIETGRRKE